MSTIHIGQSGEEVARNYLKELNYEIIGNNYRKRMGEIDIIAKDSETKELVFVEVKMRHTTTFGHPEESVTPKKLKKIIRTCQQWLQEKCLEKSSWRIDFIGIEWRKNKPVLNHIKSISL